MLFTKLPFYLFWFSSLSQRSYKSLTDTIRKSSSSTIRGPKGVPASARVTHLWTVKGSVVFATVRLSHLLSHFYKNTQNSAHRGQNAKGRPAS